MASKATDPVLTFSLQPPEMEEVIEIVHNGESTKFREKQSSTFGKEKTESSILLLMIAPQYKKKKELNLSYGGHFDVVERL